MSLLEWNEGFNLYVELLDNHHQHMDMLLNCAYFNWIENSSIVDLEKSLEEICHYTDHHFIVEDHWMKKINPDGYSEHRVQHRNFAEKALTLRKDLTGGRKNIALDILNFLKNWMTYHIGADAEHVSCMTAKHWRKCA